MAGIERVRRPQTNTRVLSIEEQARRRETARIRQFNAAVDELCMDPDAWLDLVADRAETDEEADGG